MILQLGFQYFWGNFVPFSHRIEHGCAHALITGMSGSGKSVACLYWLNSIINEVELYICDFKASGDFIGITEQYAEGKLCLELLERFYADFQAIKDENQSRRILLLFDEYAAFCSWLEHSDKAALKRVQGYISEILMLGRALPGGGSAWLWCSLQRPDSEYFPKGSRLNFHLRICMGSVSRETKTMMFPDEELPENYIHRQGSGLIARDGFTLQQFTIPRLNKEKLLQTLQEKAASERRA